MVKEKNKKRKQNKRPKQTELILCDSQVFNTCFVILTIAKAVNIFAFLCKN